MKFKRFPDTIVIVLSILILFLPLTWIIPAGEYERTKFQGKEIVVEKSYHRVEKSPQGLRALFVAPIRGFVSAAQIIGFVFLVGGAFGIINKTDSINAGLRNLIRFSMQNPRYKKIIIPSVMVVFSIAGATFGMSEEVLVFIMITIPLALGLGYDSIVGVAMPFIGAGAGFAGAVFNPFTVGIAQEIAGLDMFSGAEYRLVVWAVLTIIAIVFVMWYARKLEKNKKHSPVFYIDRQRNMHDLRHTASDTFNLRKKLIIFALGAALVLLVVGVNLWDWYINEISGLFLGLGVVAALLYRLPANDAVSAFLDGARDMMTAAIVIALTKGILIIASDGKIIDTILYSISNWAQGVHPVASAQFMFLFQGILNFFMPSGSGQAALTMPIMSPLSDLLGISRQTAVLAFQLGDGLFNLFIPTSGVTMGVLSIAKIPFQKWFKWILPLMLIFTVAAALLLIPPILFFEW